MNKTVIITIIIHLNDIDALLSYDGYRFTVGLNMQGTVISNKLSPRTSFNVFNIRSGSMYS